MDVAGIKKQGEYGGSEVGSEAAETFGKECVSVPQMGCNSLKHMVCMSVCQGYGVRKRFQSNLFIYFDVLLSSLECFGENQSRVPCLRENMLLFANV